MSTQLTLNLFPTAKHDPWEGFLEWARETKGWIPEFVEGLTDERGDGQVADKSQPRRS